MEEIQDKQVREIRVLFFGVVKVGAKSLGTGTPKAMFTGPSQRTHEGFLANRQKTLSRSILTVLQKIAGKPISGEAWHFLVSR